MVDIYIYIYYYYYFNTKNICDNVTDYFRLLQDYEDEIKGAIMVLIYSNKNVLNTMNVNDKD